MRKIISPGIMVASLGLVLAGCGGVPVAVMSGIGTALTVADKVGKVSSEVLAGTGAACASMEPAAAEAVKAASLVSAAAGAKGAAAKTYLDGVCFNLTPGNTNIDAHTPQWEADIVLGLQALAKL